MGNLNQLRDASVPRISTRIAHRAGIFILTANDEPRRFVRAAARARLCMQSRPQVSIMLTPAEDARTLAQSGIDALHRGDARSARESFERLVASGQADAAACGFALIPSWRTEIIPYTLYSRWASQTQCSADRRRWPA